MGIFGEFVGTETKNVVVYAEIKWSEKWSKTVLRGEFNIEDRTIVLY